MKLWRKHNSLLSIRKTPALKISRKGARTHFQSEHKQPSLLLCRLLGIPHESDIKPAA